MEPLIQNLNLTRTKRKKNGVYTSNRVLQTLKEYLPITDPTKCWRGQLYQTSRPTPAQHSPGLRNTQPHIKSGVAHLVLPSRYPTSFFHFLVVVAALQQLLSPKITFSCALSVHTTARQHSFTTNAALQAALTFQRSKFAPYWSKRGPLSPRPIGASR